MAEKEEKLALTVDELGERLGISRPKAYELAHRSDFPKIAIGRRIIIPVDGLRLWLAEKSGMGVADWGVGDRRC